MFKEEQKGVKNCNFSCVTGGAGAVDRSRLLAWAWPFTPSLICCWVWVLAWFQCLLCKQLCMWLGANSTLWLTLPSPPSKKKKNPYYSHVILGESLEVLIFTKHWFFLPSLQAIMISRITQVTSLPSDRFSVHFLTMCLGSLLERSWFINFISAMNPYYLMPHSAS